MSEEATVKQPNKEQIKKWKEQHGGLYQFTLPDGKIVIIREPKMKDLERAQASDPKKQKPYNFNRSILENCKLYEDEGVLQNDKNVLAIFAQMDEVIDIWDAEVKKL